MLDCSQAKMKMEVLLLSLLTDMVPEWKPKTNPSVCTHPISWIKNANKPTPDNAKSADGLANWVSPH